MPQAPDPKSPPVVLLTAFEPSGDLLGAGMIRSLRATRPDLAIFAMGGHRMEAEGATLLENTTAEAKMGLSAATQVLTHLRRLRLLKRWLRSHAVTALVAVDSPTANWSICGLVRRMQPQAKILHLAAPQIWAWAPWRIGKLRRLTDQVLCLLPFEPEWFGDRGVPAMFVGHPIFDGVATSATANTPPPPSEWPGAPGLRLALLPGSRRAEIRENLPTMLAAFDRLCQLHPGMGAVIAAVDQAKAGLIAELIAAHPSTIARPLHVAVGQVTQVLNWADVVLVVSGTATLEVAAHRKPMVTIFNANWFEWQVVRWIIQTRTFTLPNLISEAQGHGRAVPEFRARDWGAFKR